MRSVYDALAEHEARRSDLGALLESRRNTEVALRRQVEEAEQRFVESRRMVDETLAGVDLADISRTAEQYSGTLVQVETVLKDAYGRGCRTYDTKEFFGRDGLKPLQMLMLQLDLDDGWAATKKIHDFVLRGGEYFVKNSHLWGHHDMAGVRKGARKHVTTWTLAGGGLLGSGGMISLVVNSPVPALIGVALGGCVAVCGGVSNYRHELYQQCVYDPFSRLAEDIGDRMKGLEKLSAGL